MAINKELYERYKAMKAAKLAAAENENSNGSTPKVSGFAALSQGSAQTTSGFSDVTPNSQNHAEHAPEAASLPYQTNYSAETQYSQGQNFAPQTENPQSYYSQDSFKTTSQELTPTPPLEQNTSINNEPYCGNVTASAGDANYNAQFSGSFTSSYNVPKPSQYDYTIQTQEQPQQIKPLIKKFALIGYPLGHSLSGYIHEAGFKSLGISASYEILETPPDELVDVIKYLKTHGYSGFNVTIPLKLPVAMFMDEIDKSANIVNAINTVLIEPETGVLRGYNTDAAGFSAAIPTDFPLYGKTAGILGTGGAARAAIASLANKGVKEIKLYTRHIPNSLELLEYLRKTFPKIEFNSYQIDMIKDLSGINILVNATPIGMQGHAAEYTPVEEKELQTLPSDALVYDVIYNPKKTLLIRLAQKHNYKTITGMDMLIHQAVEAEKIWTGRTPDFKDMKIAALENI